MNTSPLEPPSWSRQRWLLAVGLVFAAQVVMIVLLAERPRRAVPSPQFGATINLALDAKSAQKLAELPALGDPTDVAAQNPSIIDGLVQQWNAYMSGVGGVEPLRPRGYY